MDGITLAEISDLTQFYSTVLSGLEKAISLSTAIVTVTDVKDSRNGVIVSFSIIATNTAPNDIEQLITTPEKLEVITAVLVKAGYTNAVIKTPASFLDVSPTPMPTYTPTNAVTVLQIQQVRID